jgi:hypothetical protein
MHIIPAGNGGPTHVQQAADLLESLGFERIHQKRQSVF